MYHHSPHSPTLTDVHTYMITITTITIIPTLPPSPPSQMYIMRTMLQSLLSEKSVSGRKALRGDLKESSIPEFEAFHKNSFFFTHLLNFTSE